MNAVAKNLKELRISAGLTQTQLADSLHVTRQAVSGWETGRSEPDLDTLAAVADVLGIDISELLYGIKRPEYIKNQKKYVVCCVVFGAAVILGIVAYYTLRPWIRAQAARTFNSKLYYVYLTGFEPLVYALGGALLISLILMGNDVRLSGPRRAVCLVLGVACLVPALVTAIQFAAWDPPRIGSSILKLLFPVIMGTASGDIFLKVLPFIGGAGVFLGCDRRR